jgi:hypothetical protein
VVKYRPKFSKPAEGEFPLPCSVRSEASIMFQITIPAHILLNRTYAVVPASIIAGGARGFAIFFLNPAELTSLDIAGPRVARLSHMPVANLEQR